MYGYRTVPVDLALSIEQSIAPTETPHPIVLHKDPLPSHSGSLSPTIHLRCSHDRNAYSAGRLYVVLENENPPC